MSRYIDADSFANTLQEEINYYNAKSYLLQVKLYDARINSKLEEYHRLKDMITKITPAYSESTGGAGSLDKLDKAVSRMVDLENELNSDVDVYVGLKKAVSKVLDQIDDPDQYKVLHSRYILYKTFDQIAEDMYFSRTWICNIHGRALQKISNILDKS